MHRQQPISQRLYEYLYPNPSSSDPSSFAIHLAKHLVPEVRIEVATFYGDLNSTEARYPGLNYCHPPHRLRLGRFKHHRRLFQAFDALGLTYGEIQDFCCWEGTKWARERYEKDEGIKVLDTTGDGIGPFVDRRPRRDMDECRRNSITRKTDISVVIERPLDHASAMASSRAAPSSDTSYDSDSDDEHAARSDAIGEVRASTSTNLEGRGASSSAGRPMQLPSLPTDSQSRSAYFAIHQGILSAFEQGHPLPPEVEQFLKEERERGMAGFGPRRMQPYPLTRPPPPPRLPELINGVYHFSNSQSPSSPAA